VSYLIDTNVISEIGKGANCSPRVTRWYSAIQESELYLSVLVLGELRKGVESLRARHTARANRLDKWLTSVSSAFGDRVLPISREVADEWGRLAAIRPISVIDALLAATANCHGLTFVTRNESDLRGLGIELLNPFDC
jgi:hypothetical protein